MVFIIFVMTKQIHSEEVDGGSELGVVDEVEGLLGDGEFSEVLVLEVLVDVGFVGVGLLLEVELGDVLLSVGLSLVEEVGALLDLALGGGEVDVGLVELALELGMLKLELLDSGLELDDGSLLIGGEGVEGVDDVASELVEGVDDLSDDVLVGEVLVEGELDEGVDHGALLDLVPLSLGDASDGVLELLDLEEGWVGEGLEELEGLIDGSSGLVVLSDLELVGLVLLLSDEGLLSQHLSVVGLVVVDLADVLLDLGSAGQQQVVDHVVHAGNILLGVSDVLLKGDHGRVVLVSSSLEVHVQLLESLVQVLDQLLDGVNQLLHGALHLGVEREEVKQGSTPLGRSQVLDSLLLGLGNSHLSTGNNGNQHKGDDGSLHFLSLFIHYPSLTTPLYQTQNKKRHLYVFTVITSYSKSSPYNPQNYSKHDSQNTPAEQICLHRGLLWSSGSPDDPRHGSAGTPPHHPIVCSVYHTAMTRLGTYARRHEVVQRQLMSQTISLSNPPSILLQSDRPLIV